MLLYLFLQLIVLTAVKPVWAQASILSDAEFDELKSISHKVMEASESAKSVYIGVGRSPVGVIAYLSQIPSVKTGLVPFSAAGKMERSLIDLKSSSDPKNQAKYVQVQDRLDQHLHKFLDPLIANGQGRKLIFVDYVVSGGLQSALRIIGDFLKRNHPDVEFDFLALTTEANWEKNQSWMPREKAVLLTGYRRLEIQLIKSFYSDWAPYAEFNYLNLVSGTPVEMRSDYLDLMTEIHQRISQDATKAIPQKPVSCQRAVGD